MGILVGKDTRLVVQGITGREGSSHADQMLEYGTNIVAGVTPGRGDRGPIGWQFSIASQTSLAAKPAY